MITKGLLARFEAKPGCETKLKKALQEVLPFAEAEQKTPVWFAIQFGANAFGLFDAFQDEEGRTAHMSGAIPSALMQKVGELLASPPVMETVDVIAAKS